MSYDEPHFCRHYPWGLLCRFPERKEGPVVRLGGPIVRYFPDLQQRRERIGVFAAWIHRGMLL